MRQLGALPHPQLAKLRHFHARALRRENCSLASAPSSRTPFMSAHRTVPVDTDKMPPGIPYIISNEAAERFSFYGMRTILVVFMVKYLFLMDGKGGTAMGNAEAVEH